MWAQPTITKYPIAQGSGAVNLTLGADRNLWFTEMDGNGIGKITPQGLVTEYALPTRDTKPTGIAAGPDGNLWFTETKANQIGRITTSGAIAEYPLPTPNAYPGAIAAGPDGNLWFTEFSASKVGKISVSGTITEYALPPNSTPFGIAAGADGKLWFTEPTQICSITTSGVVTNYPVPDAPNGPITPGPDGNVWFTGSNSIWYINSTGPVLVFTGRPAFDGMAWDRVGNLWLTEGLDQIAKFTPGGTLTEYLYSYHEVAWPTGISRGADGNMWFVDAAFFYIGRFDPYNLVPDAVLNVNPPSLKFYGALEVGPSSSQTVAVTSEAPLSFYAASNSPWLTISPSGNLTAGQSITVTADPTQLRSPGTYTGNFFLQHGNVTQDVFVTLVVRAPTGGAVHVAPATLDFRYVTQTATPAPQAFTVARTSPGIEAIPFTVSNTAAWLTIATAGGVPLPNGGSATTDTGLVATVDPSVLQPGSYFTTLAVTPLNGPVVLVPVTLTVTANTTTLTASQTEMHWTYVQGGAQPRPQFIAISEAGVALPFTATIAGGSQWLVVNPAVGGIGIFFNSGVAGTGTYTETVVITVPQAKSPAPVITIAVSLTVVSAQSPIVEYAVPGSTPTSLVYGLDGSLWFTDTGSRATLPSVLKIGKINIDGVATEYALPPAPYSEIPGALTHSADRNVWYTDQGNQLLGKVTPNGAVQVYSTAPHYPRGIAADSLGGIWYTVGGESLIGRLTPAGVKAEFAFPYPQGAGLMITQGPDGNMWFTTDQNQIGKITPAGAITLYSIPAGLDAYGITAGPDSSLWFTQWHGVGKITTSGAYTGYTVSAFTSGFGAITNGPDGNLWFTESAINKIACMTPNGVVTEFVIPSAEASPNGITTGPDGNIWFTESGTGKIGKIVLAAVEPNIATIMNLAARAGNAIAPGEWVSILGTGLGPAVPQTFQLDLRGQVSSALGGVSVSFGGFPAPLLYVSATEIRCIVPYDTGGGDLHVAYNGQVSPAFTIPVASAVTGIFTANGTGSGPALLLPSPPGTLSFYVTGEGQTNPPGVTGGITVLNPSGNGPLTPQPLQAPLVTIGGRDAPVLFYGEAPGLAAGILQINVQIPARLLSGDQPLVVHFGSAFSQPHVTVPVP